MPEAGKLCCELCVVPVVFKNKPQKGSQTQTLLVLTELWVLFLVSSYFPEVKLYAVKTLVLLMTACLGRGCKTHFEVGNFAF